MKWDTNCIFFCTVKGLSSKVQYLWLILPAGCGAFSCGYCVQVPREPRRAAVSAVQRGEVVRVVVPLADWGPFQALGRPGLVEEVQTRAEISNVSRARRAGGGEDEDQQGAGHFNSSSHPQETTEAVSFFANVAWPRGESRSSWTMRFGLFLQEATLLNFPAVAAEQKQISRDRGTKQKDTKRNKRVVLAFIAH